MNCESVIIKAGTDHLTGELLIGDDWLPEVRVECCGSLEYYSIFEWPATWTLSSPTCGDLYMAWREIEEIRERLRTAEREALNATCPDCCLSLPCPCMDALPGPDLPDDDVRDANITIRATEEEIDAKK